MRRPSSLAHPDGPRTCSTCGVEKPAGEFAPRAAGGGRPSSRCLECRGASVSVGLPPEDPATEAARAVLKDPAALREFCRLCSLLDPETARHLKEVLEATGRGVERRLGQYRGVPFADWDVNRGQ